MPGPNPHSDQQEGSPATLATPPIISIIGDRVALGPLRRDLIPLYQRWINDFTLLRTRGRPPRGTTLEAQQREYDELATSGSRHTFTIYDRATWQPIGDTGLFQIDLRFRSAFFFITIGEPTYRGRGYGTEATRLILDYAFTTLCLHSVKLEVAEFNPAGINAYRNAGFHEVGRWRQSWPLDGRLWDTICMDSLATEFTSSPLDGKNG